MGKKKKGRASPGKKRPKTPVIFRIFKDKIEKIRKLEKKYWEEITKRRTYLKEINPDSDEKLELVFPSNISSRIYACLDGVVLLRYFIPEVPTSFEIAYFNSSVSDFLNHLIVPTRSGDVVLPGIKMACGASLRLLNCIINDLIIDFLWVNSFFYNDEAKLSSIEDAITDFKMYLLGLNVDPALEFLKEPKPSINIIERIEDKVKEFETLLDMANKEEEIQEFLKQNTFLIQPYTSKISKQKLGEDFVTDFVLVNMLDQGPKYTLVEIEKSSMSILTKTNEFTAEFRHAEKQILDWDIWLQDNQDYIQRKLEKFESPAYLIIGGRSKDIDEEGKRYIRAWNRSKKDTIFLTYDDLLEKIKELIETLKRDVNNR